MADPAIVICPACGGSLWIADDIACPVCEQTGKVTVAQAAEWQAAQDPADVRHPWPIGGPRKSEGEGAGAGAPGVGDRALWLARRSALIQLASALKLQRDAVLQEVAAIEQAYRLGGKHAKS